MHMPPPGQGDPPARIPALESPPRAPRGSAQHIDPTINEARDVFNTLRGQLFSLADASMPESRQAEGFKSLVRQITYAVQADLEAILNRRR
jgi:hypothetical protein